MHQRIILIYQSYGVASSLSPTFKILNTLMATEPPFLFRPDENDYHNNDRDSDGYGGV